MNRAARRLLGMAGVFVFFFVYGIGATFYDDQIKPFFSTPTPTAKVARIRPTVTPIRRPSSTPNTCFLWSQITAQMEGRTVCVYGTVTEHVENFDAKQTFLYFEGRDKFFLTSLYQWEETQDICVSVTGKVQLNTYQTPYIKFDDLSPCNAESASPTYTNPLDTSTYSGCPEGCIVHPSGCDIKGNISIDSGAKIYHLPAQKYYSATNIDTSYGERWFCTEAEAISNGWRKSTQ